MRTQVLIVGAGPVGLSAAMDLAWRGIDVVVLEQRHRGEPPSVKSNHVSARSMEIFRRLGVVERFATPVSRRTIRTMCAYRTSVSRHRDRPHKNSVPCRSLTRKAVQTHGGRRLNRRTHQPDLPRTGPARSSRRHAGVRILDAHPLRRRASRRRRASAHAQNIDTGEEIEIACRFMVGCDGGRSLVRKKIGAKRRRGGRPRVQSTYIGAPKLLLMLQGWHAGMGIVRA